MKSTEELMSVLKSSKDIENFIKTNSSDFVNNQKNAKLRNHLNQLIVEKKMNISSISDKSGIQLQYTYEIFNGKKTPSRDKLIAIAIAFCLNLEETNRLLKMADESELYPKIKRESVIIYCINNKMDMIKINELLDDLNENIIQ